jgi:hypothetical protein
LLQSVVTNLIVSFDSHPSQKIISKKMQDK